MIIDSWRLQQIEGDNIIWLALLMGLLGYLVGSIKDD